MTYRIRLATADEMDDVVALDRETLPEAPPSADTVWWSAWLGVELVGYAGARPAWPGVAYLSRSGVAEAHRGNGIQKRLIRARVQWARRVMPNTTHCATYTAPHNAPSMRALITCGFRPYEPVTEYAGPHAVYWRKVL